MIIHGYFFSSDVVKFQNGGRASLYSEPTRFATYMVEIDAESIDIKEDKMKYIVIQKKAAKGKEQS